MKAVMRMALEARAPRLQVRSTECCSYCRLVSMGGVAVHYGLVGGAIGTSYQSTAVAVSACVTDRRLYSAAVAY
jgi:hypothetical protein